MERSRAFRPSSPDALEGRVVLSQVFFSPEIGVISGAKSAHAGMARSGAQGTIHSATQTKLADGQAETTDISVMLEGAGGTSTTEVTREPDGTSKVVRESATMSGGIKTFSDAITLPDGLHQTETGTDVIRGSTTTILPDGTLQANPGSNIIASTTMTFDRKTTQAGLGTETIRGSSVAESFKDRTVTVTDQQVTNFDGTQDEVKLVAIRRNGTTTTHKTTILPGGATTMTVSTTKLLSSKPT